MPHVDIVFNKSNVNKIGSSIIGFKSVGWSAKDLEVLDGEGRIGDSRAVKLYEPSRGDVCSPFIGDVLRPSLDRNTLDPNSSVVKLYEPSRGDVRSPFVGEVLLPSIDHNMLDPNSDL